MNLYIIGVTCRICNVESMTKQLNIGKNIGQTFKYVT